MTKFLLEWKNFKWDHIVTQILRFPRVMESPRNTHLPIYFHCQSTQILIFFPGCISSSSPFISFSIFFFASILLILCSSLLSFWSLFCFRVFRPSCIFTPNWNAAFGMASFCSLYFAHSSSVSKSHRWRRPFAYKYEFHSQYSNPSTLTDTTGLIPKTNSE